ncbi:uncharacterized protein LOC128555255 [Mercenaria mercenaria]|uniref:uncharacterized protein LOC128555255 n=1 Tax=Mercenaria mercenaria TaxID=6596 RepID=UPI00234E4129|nr:uncharacterized protein LOC128555255 [Mercenaria mercenaria]
MSLSKPPTPHIYSDGEKRHFRIMSMINEEGQHVLRLILDKLLGGTALAERLAESETKENIQDALGRSKIQKDQYDMLYPSSGIIHKEHFDVTLLTFLIRQIHPFMKVSNKIWSDPNHGDLSPEADVTRLKKKRNKLAHLGKATLTEDEYVVEFQKLEMILCRLARYASSADLTVADLALKLENKKHGVFESKPLTSNVATSVSSSLNKDPASESDSSSTYSAFKSLPFASNNDTSFSGSLDSDHTKNSDSVSIYSLSSMESKSSSVSGKDIKKEIATSTSSLQKKRKLSFKVRSYLEPFISSPNKEGEKENTDLPKRIKTKDKKKDSRQRCKSCSCTLKGSCKSVEANLVKTNDHSSQKYRCNISGLTMLNSGILIATDSSHDVVQALALSGNVLDEFECAQPNSVVAVGSSKFAVTLLRSSKVKILKFNNDNNCIEAENEFNVDCDSWLSDMKYSSGYLYTLCENGDLHILNVKTGSDAGLFPTKVQCISHFDIANKGDRIFISHGHHISCLDGFGNTIWCYSDKTKRTFKGIVLRKNTIFVCAWDKDKIISLATKDGKCLKEYSDEQMRCPWSVCALKGKLFVSQYMSDLNSESCSEIVVMQI